MKHKECKLSERWIREMDCAIRGKSLLTVAGCASDDDRHHVFYSQETAEALTFTATVNGRVSKNTIYYIQRQQAVGRSLLRLRHSCEEDTIDIKRLYHRLLENGAGGGWFRFRK